jgi:D-serine deaminase-like pyridoxal phosphate-dependent protein
MGSEFQLPMLPPIGRYAFAGREDVMSPALLIYPEIVDSNIRETIALLDGRPDRWRPHVKTAKLGFVMKRMVDHGVSAFKCSTTLELRTICEAGATDVLMAFPIIGPGARRVREIAALYPSVRISVLVDSLKQAENWAGGNIGAFIDVNPGMDRTGIQQSHEDDIRSLAADLARIEVPFRGLHYYDGHLSSPDLKERCALAHKGYDWLLQMAGKLGKQDLKVEEIITAGTPAFPCTVSYKRFGTGGFTHRASPGTAIYNDCSSLTSLPSEYNYQPAVVVMTRVVSAPTESIVTCDAGHKAVSADAGVPTCAVVGYPNLTPLKPSEEHLPIRVAEGTTGPRVGEILFLVPRHICPTVNNFDDAVMVADGRIAGVEIVTARGREAPLVSACHAEPSPLGVRIDRS